MCQVGKILTGNVSVELYQIRDIGRISDGKLPGCTLTFSATAL